MGATFASSINLQMLLLTQNIMIMARREGFHFFVAAAQRKKAPPWFNGADNYTARFYSVSEFFWNIGFSYFEFSEKQYLSNFDHKYVDVQAHIITSGWF